MKRKIRGKEKAAVLFSGGKDSSLALFYARKKFNVRCVACILPKKEDSLFFHKPIKKLLKRQARELRIKLIIKRSSAKDKAIELHDLKKLLNKIKKFDKNIDVLVIGGIKSNFQGKRFSYIAKNTGFRIFTPLWNYSEKKLWKDLFRRNFKIIITKISCEGIPKWFLGEIINRQRFEELRKLSKKYRFTLDFEGGDAETTVLYMPGFSKEIKIKKFKIKSEGAYRYFMNNLKIIKF